MGESVNTAGAERPDSDASTDTASPDVGTTWLIRLTSAPNFSSRALQGIDTVLACGAFGQSVTVVIEGEALELLRENLGAAPGERNLYRQIESLPLYDIDTLYVVTHGSDDGEPARDWAPPEIEDLAVLSISRATLGNMIAKATHVLSF